MRRFASGHLRIILACAAVALGLLAAGGYGGLRHLTAGPLDPAPYLAAGSSPVLTARDGSVLHAYLDADDHWRFPVALDAVSPHLVEATIAVEDQRFREHRGVDALAVVRAAWQNARALRVVSGASTLTMQVVKLRTGGERSLAGKFTQAVDALRLERHADKNAILAAYLNKAPYGRNLAGVEAASQRYYGKPARELAVHEAALLAGLPKAPTRFDPLDHPNAARARRDHVLRRMCAEGFLTAAACERALAQPPGAAWHAFPEAAPHVAARAATVARRGGEARTTLDPAIQRRVAKLVRASLAEHEDEVTNAAAIVARVDDASVLAWAGSADFFATPGGGQVDAARAPRSPGSTLKPFTYALAMENNCLYADELLCDGTVDYGLYSPENYDGRFRGAVPAGYALRRSLNIPAVAVLERLEAGALHGFLRTCGFSTLRAGAERYGLGLTLGNCEARLDELTQAYVMLANLGEWRPLRWLNTAPAPARRVLAPGVCLQVCGMLEQPLPGEPVGDFVEARTGAGRVAWKTGTSTGHHDAWAFVFNAHYVVGVWMGNNDGTPSRRLTGAHAALPLAARITRSLPRPPTPDWPAPGDDLVAAETCALTGLPASPHCPHTRTAYYPRGQYLQRRCAVHGPAGESDAPAVRWPASAQGWDLASLDRRGEPAAPSRPLRIAAPADGARFVLTGEPGGDRLRLETSLDRHAELHWYLDESYLGRSAPGAPLHLALEPGAHRLTCMTADGAGEHSVRFEAGESRSGRTFRQ